MWVTPIYLLLIFVSWFICLYLGGVKPLINGQLLFPLIWAIVFLYQRRQGYTYISQVAYLLFLLMVLADELNFGFSLYRSKLAYVTASIGFSLSWQYLFAFAYRLGKHGRKWVLFGSIASTLGLITLPLSLIIYSLSFGIGISRDVIYAILASNRQESVEFGVVFLSPLWALLIVLCMGFVVISFIKQQPTPAKDLNGSLLLTQITLSVIILGTQAHHFSVFRFPLSCIYNYQKELSAFRTVQDSIKADQIRFDALKQGAGETYIVVIGESLNKNHMSLYGYPRTTNPLLSKYADAGELIVFNRVYSSHTLTTETLSLSFTEANQRNQKDYFESLSLLNILKKAEFETTWITNQVLHGAWDNVVSVFAHQADVLIPFNHWVGKVVETRYLDEMLLEPLVDLIAESTEKNRVIFVHLMGNHSDYEQRYSAPFNKFSNDEEILDTESWSGLSEAHRQTINHYDNSVLYNDFIISSMLDLLKQAEGVSGLFYFSDHGEDVQGERYHHSDLFTFEMVQIPLVTWFSTEYQSKYPERYKNLQYNTEALFCNDSIYETLIGIFGIESDRYSAHHDLSSDQYELLLEDALTMHGTVNYEDAFKSEEIRKNAEALARERR